MLVTPFTSLAGVLPGAVVVGGTGAAVLIARLVEIRLELGVGGAAADPAIDVIVAAEAAGVASDLRRLVPDELVTGNGGRGHALILDQTVIQSQVKIVTILLRNPGPFATVVGSRATSVVRRSVLARSNGVSGQAFYPLPNRSNSAY